ncbi:hypothetical protein ACLNGM_15105 [Aureimonas phyllosphaerae]
MGLPFIAQNGGTFAAPDTEEVGSWIEALVERKIDLAEFDARLRPFVVLR